MKTSEAQTSFKQEWKEVEKAMQTDSLSLVINRFNNYSSYVGEDKDSLYFNRLIKVTEYYQKKGEFGEQISCYEQLLQDSLQVPSLVLLEIRRKYAMIYQTIQEYEEANHLLLKDILFLCNNELYADLSIQYSMIAYNFIKLGNLELSNAHYLQSLSSAIKAQRSYHIIYAYNNFGLFYEKLNDFENAEKMYLSGIKYFELKSKLESDEEIQFTLLKGNLGGLYIRTFKDSTHNAKNYSSYLKKGEAYLLEDAYFNILRGEYYLGINAALSLTNYYKEIGKELEALKILNFARDHVPDTPLNEAEKEQLAIINLEISAIFERQGDFRMALKNYQVYDSINTLRIKHRQERRADIEKGLLTQVMKAQLNIQKNKVDLQKQESERLKNEKRLQLFISILIGISILIILFLIIYGYRKRVSVINSERELIQNQLEISKLQQEKTEMELKYKNKDLTDFAIDILNYQDVMETIKARLKKVKAHKGHPYELEREIRDLNLFINSSALSNQQFKKFQKNVKKINYHFFDHLKLKYQDLTELDLYLCGMIRLGLKNKEIATIRNVSEKAIKMGRYRLRKKLDSDMKENLTQFLKSIN